MRLIQAKSFADSEPRAVLAEGDLALRLRGINIGGI